MTDEEKQAIELLRTIKRPTLATGFERQTNLLKSIKVVLNLIEKQQAEIEQLQKKLSKYSIQLVSSNWKQMHKHNEDLEMLYQGCQIELEKKDAIIDLIAEQLTTPIHSKEWVIEYYTKKVEEE